VGVRGYLTGGKAARREFDHSPPLRAELRIESMHAFMAWTGKDLIYIRNK